MTELKLGKLPNRKSVKISFEAHPDLAEALDAYASAYEQAYGQSEPVAELVPYMLEGFLKGDRAFAKFREPSKPNRVQISSPALPRRQGEQSLSPSPKAEA
jgi:hypothetical protein